MKLPEKLLKKSMTATSANAHGKLVVLLSGGPKDGGKRATLAFTAACTSIAMGRATLIFLAGEGSCWAYEGTTQSVAVKGFPPLSDLVADFQELGGELYICSSCDQVCVIDGVSEQTDFVRCASIQSRGFAAILDELDGGVSLSF